MATKVKKAQEQKQEGGFTVLVFRHVITEAEKVEAGNKADTARAELKNLRSEIMRLTATQKRKRVNTTVKARMVPSATGMAVEREDGTALDASTLTPMHWNQLARAAQQGLK